MLRRVSIAATLISSAPFSQLLAHLFRAVKRADGRIHRLTVHDHDMAFFHRLQLADGGIALRNLIFSSALSSAQRLRSRLATTITSGLAAMMLSPAHRGPLGLGGYRIMSAQHAGDKSGGAVFAANIGIGRRRGAGEPEDEGEILCFYQIRGAGRLHVFLKSAISA